MKRRNRRILIAATVALAVPVLAVVALQTLLYCAIQPSGMFVIG